MIRIDIIGLNRLRTIHNFATQLHDIKCLGAIKYV